MEHSSLTLLKDAVCFKLSVLYDVCTKCITVTHNWDVLSARLLHVTYPKRLNTIRFNLIWESVMESVGRIYNLCSYLSKIIGRSSRIIPRWQPSAIRHRVVSLMYTDVSDVHTAYVVIAIVLRLNSAVSQKAVVSIVTAVRTWNLTFTKKAT
jgi:hypothetical protein